MIIKDVDLKILLSLDLQDVEQYCLVSTYSNLLCQNELMKLKLDNAKSLVNKILKLNRERYTLMFKNELEEVISIHTIVKYLGFKEGRGKDLSLLDEATMDNLIIRMRGDDKYIITIQTYLYEKTEIYFLLTLQQLKLFLIHLIYDDILLIL